MTSQLTILPGQGIGPIRLGMRPAEVLTAFPEPRVVEDWMGGNAEDCLRFHGLRLRFDRSTGNGPESDSTLLLIAIHQREDASLFGRSISEWSKTALVEELRTHGFQVDFNPNGDVDVEDKLSLSFGDDGRLIWIEI